MLFYKSYDTQHIILNDDSLYIILECYRIMIYIKPFATEHMMMKQDISFCHPTSLIKQKRPILP